jgi:hypothetical protein
MEALVTKEPASDLRGLVARDVVDDQVDVEVVGDRVFPTPGQRR